MSRFRFRPWMILAALLALLVVVFFGTFYFDSDNYRKSSTLEKAVGTLTDPVVAGTSGVGSAVKGFFGRLFALRQVDKDYAALKIRVQQLELQKQFMQDLEIENQQLTEQLGYKDQYPEPSYISAHVIARNSGSWFVDFDLNRGSNDGVANGDIVVNDLGLVGSVVDVQPTFCKVMTIIDRQSSVSIMIRRTTDPGMVDGSGEPQGADVSLGIYNLPLDAEMTPGDVVVTSELGGRFPRGIHVGTVTLVGTDDKLQPYAMMKPSVDFAHITDVSIIRMTPAKPGSSATAHASPTSAPSAGKPQQTSASPSAKASASPSAKASASAKATVSPSAKPSATATAKQGAGN